MRLARTPSVAVAVVLTIALGIPLLGDAPAEARTALTVAPGNPVHLEYIYIRGSVTTGNARPVRLQYYKPDVGWRNLSDGRSGPAGYFRFRTRAIAPQRTYRVVAPRVTINGRTYSGQITRARRVRTVQPSASIRLVPAPIGQARNITSTDLTPVNVAFRPIRRGRKVMVQRYARGAWRNVAYGVQNARGSATFNISTKYARNYYHRAVAASHNGASPVVSKGYYARTLRRRFNDDFRMSSLNLDKWKYRQHGRRQGPYRYCSESNWRAVRPARNGAGNFDYLSLQVRRIPTSEYDTYDTRRANNGACPQGQFYNGHIGTQGQGKFSTTYGIMAARLQFPPGMGQHGSLWSQPKVAGSGAEIDIVEYFGDAFPLSSSNPWGVPAGVGAVQHKVYWEDAAGVRRSHGRPFDLSHLVDRDRDFSDRFHIFSVEWTPSVYIFRVDGHETFRTRRGTSHAAQYLILSLLTSDYEIPNLKQRLPSNMLVDWVRVW